MWLIALLIIWAILAPGGVFEVLLLSLIFSPVLIAVYLIGEMIIYIFKSGKD